MDQTILFIISLVLIIIIIMKINLRCLGNNCLGNRCLGRKRFFKFFPDFVKSENFEVANVSSMNIGIPAYFQKYGDHINDGLNLTSSGACATDAQYNDMFFQAQKNPLTSLNNTYEIGGATSDLNSAYNAYKDLNLYFKQ